MPTISEANSSTALSDVRSAHHTVAVAYLGQGDQTVCEQFMTVAKDMKDDFVFCTSHAPDLATQEGVNTPSVVLYKHVADEKTILLDPSSSTAIRDFVQTAAQPLLTEFLPELHEAMLQVGSLVLPL